MAEYYVGEIRLFGFDYAPVDWLACEGQLVPINQYEILFSLLGTIYGGDGNTNFGIPDLRGRFIISAGQGMQSTFTLGAAGGTEQVALQSSHWPSHLHTLNGGQPATPPVTAKLMCSSKNASTGSASNGVEAISSIPARFVNTAPDSSMRAGSIVASGATDINVGGMSIPHDNMSPFLVGRYCVCFNGIYPQHP